MRGWRSSLDKVPRPPVKTKPCGNQSTHISIPVCAKSHHPASVFLTSILSSQTLTHLSNDRENIVYPVDNASAISTSEACHPILRARPRVQSKQSNQKSQSTPSEYRVGQRRLVMAVSGLKVVAELQAAFSS